MTAPGGGVGHATEPRRRIGAATRIAVLLGHPVAHSVSPAMHNAAFEAARLDWVYLAADVAPGDGAIAAAVAGLAALGAGGANVTVPHKQAVMVACDRLTDRARAVGAVNTLVFGDGVTGDNTDVAGFRDGLPPQALGRRLDRAVVLGAGGAARAVVAALVGAGRPDDAPGEPGESGESGESGQSLAWGGSHVTVVARDPVRARSLVSLGPPGSVTVRGMDDPALGSAVRAAGLVVNATPLGWQGDRLPEPFHALHDGQVAYDLNYADDPSPFLVDAQRAGADAVDGLAMVVGQAVASFAAWTGVDPDRAAMLAAARSARASRHEPRTGPPGAAGGDVTVDTPSP